MFFHVKQFQILTFNKYSRLLRLGKFLVLCRLRPSVGRGRVIVGFNIKNKYSIHDLVRPNSSFWVAEMTALRLQTCRKFSNASPFTFNNDNAKTNMELCSKYLVLALESYQIEALKISYGSTQNILVTKRFGARSK